MHILHIYIHTYIIHTVVHFTTLLYVDIDAFLKATGVFCFFPDPSLGRPGRCWTPPRTHRTHRARRRRGRRRRGWRRAARRWKRRWGNWWSWRRWSRREPLWSLPLRYLSISELMVSCGIYGIFPYLSEENGRSDLGVSINVSQNGWFMLVYFMENPHLKWMI